MSDTNSLATPPREEMISTAVKFLQNPKVRQSPFSQRRDFLLKKGLTENEIDIAVERSGTGTDQIPSSSSSAVPPQSTALVQQQYVVPPSSLWVRTKDFVSTAVIVGGLSYAVYKLIRVYVAPHWFGPSKSEKQMESLQNSIDKLNANITELIQTVQSRQDNLTELAESISKSKNNNDWDKTNHDQKLTDLKEDVKSVKALLLSRKQFPSVPSSKPIIPSWQLAASGDSQSMSEKDQEASGDSPSVSGKDQEASGDSPSVSSTDIEALGDSPSVSGKDQEAIGDSTLVSVKDKEASGDSPSVSGKVQEALGDSTSVSGKDKEASGDSPTVSSANEQVSSNDKTSGSLNGNQDINELLNGDGNEKVDNVNEKLDDNETLPTVNASEKSKVDASDIQVHTSESVNGVMENQSA